VGFAPPPAVNPAEEKEARNRFMLRLEQTIAPLLSAEQRPLFDRWKRERESTRTATVWVLGKNGELDDRIVRLGVADDDFTEIVGRSALEPSELVVTRMREVRK
jgi:hypothetical protein